MSITDPTPDVQPDEGQGDGGQGAAPYQEWLDRIPEQVRGDVEPVFRDWDAKTTQRFQEAASFKKQWEPLAATGVDQLSPEEVAWLVQFRGALDDPNVMQQWWDGYAQENGLTAAQQAQVEPQLDDFGGFQDPAQLQSLIDQATGPLKQQLEQMQGQFEQQQQQQSIADANKFVEGQIAELEQKHGTVDRDVLAVFAGKYADSDPMNAIGRGYDDMVKFVNGIEKGALQPKVDAPSPAEGGGVPDVSPDKLPRLGSPELKDVAAQFLRNNR